MFRRKDILVIAAVLLIAAAAYGIMMLARSGQQISGMVEVYADGALQASAPLDKNAELTVEQPNGDLNIVKIEDGAVWMEHSSCKNQLCLSQGTITADNWTRRAMGRTIICLPNHVYVELALAEGHPTLADPNAPDI